MRPLLRHDGDSSSVLCTCHVHNNTELLEDVISPGLQPPVLVTTAALADGRMETIPSMPPPSHEGFMEKKGVVNRSWAKRYFTLRGNYLCRSASEGGEVVGRVDLAQCAGVRASLAPSAKENEIELLAPAPPVDTTRTSSSYL